MKVVSLVPSITELLFTLGLNEEVAGITKFCIHPKEWYRAKPRIGGTKDLNIQKIKELRPTLIIANKEENVKEQIEELGRDFEVLLTDVNNFKEALLMINVVGHAIKKEQEALNLTESINEVFKGLEVQNKYAATYLIWQNPYMTIGGDTFINDMMVKAGFLNVFADRQRYPEITLDDLRSLNPEFILLSSEPYPFGQKHADYFQKQFPHSEIILVNGEMFSWYGSRMLLAAKYFQEKFSF